MFGAYYFLAFLGVASNVTCTVATVIDIPLEKQVFFANCMANMNVSVLRIASTRDIRYYINFMQQNGFSL